MKYGDKFYKTGGCTIVSEDNIDDLIFDQMEEIQEVQKAYYQTPEIEATIKFLKEELCELRDLRSSAQGTQQDLFPEMEAV